MSKRLIMRQIFLTLMLKFNRKLIYMSKKLLRFLNILDLICLTLLPFLACFGDRDVLTGRDLCQLIRTRLVRWLDAADSDSRANNLADCVADRRRLHAAVEAVIWEQGAPEADGTTTWNAPQAGCLVGLACLFADRQADELLSAMSKGGAFRFTFSDRHGQPQDLSWSLSRFAEALTDFETQSMKRGL